MKTISHIAFAIIIVAFFSFSAHAQRQTKLYIDDNTGHFSILQATNAGGGGTLTFPAGNGTLVTSASSPALGSLLYANGAGGWTTLTPGTNTYALTLTSGVPEWQPETGFSLPYNQSFAPGLNTAAFTITNTSDGGYAIEGIDNSSGSGGGVGVRGETSTGIGVVGITTNGIAGVDAASSGTALGLYCVNLGTGGSSGSAIGSFTGSGNTQPNISINNFGNGPDIEGTNDSWQVIDADLTLGLNGTTNPIAGQLNILDGTSPGNITQFSWSGTEFQIQPLFTSSLTTDVLAILGQETFGDGGTGGNVNISGGSAGESSGTGGNVSINGGDENATLIGNGGGVAIFGGFGGENSGVGGGASLSGGPGGGASTGGAVQVIGGSGGTNISGTGGAGGNSYLAGGGGGNVSTGTNGSGGGVEIEGGQPGTGGAGGLTGQVNIQDVGGNTQIGNTAGTVNIIGLGSLSALVDPQSGNFSIGPSDNIVNETVAATTVTLPSTATVGRIITVIDESSGNVTVSGNGHTINGSATFGLVTHGSDVYNTPSSVTVVGDGTNWWIIARG